MRVAFLENKVLQVGILIDKGADLFEFTYKPRDLDFLWQSPIPLRRPFVATSALPEGAFHDYYYGGWQEVLPSAGWAEQPYLGTYQGLHGEISLLPFEAHIKEDSPHRVSLHLSTRCYRSPLLLERTMTLDAETPVLSISERLVNESPEDFAVMWGHHPAFGEPFLDDSCVVQTPAKMVRVLEYHRNGLWEPGDDYRFPQVKNRRSGELQDVTRVLPKGTRSVDVILFGASTRAGTGSLIGGNVLDSGWPGTSAYSNAFGCGRSTEGITTIRGMAARTTARSSHSRAGLRSESLRRSRTVPR